ncbi:MAG TPA: FkbM family methyltransferase [Clostridia bacterium]|nr:FkbM family methyltransferase [Clostridia bacterium]
MEQSRKASALKVRVGDFVRNIGRRDRIRGNKETLLYKLAFNYLKGYNNRNQNMAMNGEWDLLSRYREIKGGDPCTIFDVGANVGDWSLAAARIFPESMIFSFEMCPETFNTLKENTSGIDKINCINAALSDCNIKEFEISCLGGNYGRNSIGFPPEGQLVQSVIPMMTGDTYCSENSIGNIDFLKVDVEGHELKVLKGFKDMLRNGCVDIIQFELNEYGINSRIVLDDFEDLLGERYRIGKLYPGYIDFEMKDRFEFWLSSPNYVAVRTDNKTAEPMGFKG